MSFTKKILKKLGIDEGFKPNPLNYKHVELFYWKPHHTNELNFGDHLSYVIVTKILADNGYLLEEETAVQKRLIALGSVIHFAHDNDVIWGSGNNGKVKLEEHQYTQLDVRAVRGPLTREFLQKRNIEVPEVYGDPALLLPYTFPGRFKKNPQKKHVVIPNLHDLRVVESLNYKNIISPLSSWNACIKQILEAEFVIASSLHGLIIAEAYGIPARYIRLSEEENLFKYNDYAMGTGRKEIEFARTIEEAIEMGGMPPINFDHQRLLNAFPLDLWK